MHHEQNRLGFTIVELLIVIVIVAVLAAITVVAYRGLQNRAKNSSTQTAISNAQKLVEAYAALNGSYPSTGGLNNVYTDSNCPWAADSDGQKTENWIPDLSSVSTSRLPQGNFTASGRASIGGCYAYASNGTEYVLSAWNGKFGGATTAPMYRRLGFREGAFFGSSEYVCNQTGNIGGFTPTYSAGNDFYKQSYTISNITSCNETPPAGA